MPRYALDALVAEQRISGTREDNAAAFEHVAAGGDADRRLRVLLGQQDGGAARIDRANGVLTGNPAALPPNAKVPLPGSAGLVVVYNPSSGGHTVVHFGEIVFSVDK